MGETLSTKPWNVTVPHIYFFEHPIGKKMHFAKDKSFELSKIIAQAKQNKIVYQSLADPVYSGDWSPLTKFKVNDWSVWVVMASFVLIISVTIALFLLYKKYRQLTFLVTLLSETKSAQALTITDTPILNWNPYSTVAADTHSAWNIDPTHIYIMILITSIVLVSLILLLLYLFGRCKIRHMQSLNWKLQMDIRVFRFQFCRLIYVHAIIT